MNLKYYLMELRVQESYKNLLILLAPFFSKRLLDLNYYPNIVLGFAALFLNSSACYIINDIKDAGFDAFHPRKKNRPIASGKIKKSSALLFSTMLLIFSLLISYERGISFLIICILLFLNSTAYSFFLRNMVWLDLISISLNYVFRTLAGCCLVNVVLSPWLLMGVFYVAMLLALVKRREEAIILDRPELHRRTLKQYSINLIDQVITIFSTLILISYSLYTFHSPYSNNLLPFTIPLVTLIVLEFILISKTSQENGIMRAAFSNSIIIVSLLVWFILVTYLIYFC
jgi:4-hydroxybenzoate polyprenyltransferase